MATIIKRQTKSGTKWQVQVRLAGVKTISKTVDTEELARSLGSTIEQKAREAFARPAFQSSEKFYNIPFRTAIDGYLQTSLATPTDEIALTSARRYVGSVHMGQVTREFAKDYLDKLLVTLSRQGRPFTPKTISQHFSAMTKVWRWQTELYQLPDRKSPFSYDLLPKDFEVSRDQRLSKEHGRSIILATKYMRPQAGRHLRLLIRLALETAARMQELVLAEWSEFDLETHVWTIPASHEKTNRGRMVPLTSRARRILKMLGKLKGAGPRVFHHLKDPYCASLRYHCIAKRAGVPVRFHDLRHEAISRLVKRHPNLPPLTLMKIVGHSSITMLDRYYNPTAKELSGLLG